MQLTLHHVGIVVSDIAAATSLYTSRFGYEVKSDIIHDSWQRAYVRFLRLPGDQTYLEFVSPDGPESRLHHALAKKQSIHHLCYATGDIDSTCRDLQGRGMTLVRAPVSAVAFRGRRIAWMMGRDYVLVELVEKSHDNDL